MKTTAQTVFYDNLYLQLDQYQDQKRREPPAQQQRNFPRPQQSPNYAGNFHNNIRPPGNFPVANNVNLNCNPQQQNAIARPFQPPRRPEPMEIDSSKQFRHNNNWRSLNTPQKREYDSSRQHVQRNKMQRINQLESNDENPHDGYEGDIHDDIPSDLVSITMDESDRASAFLAE